MASRAASSATFDTRRQLLADADRFVHGLSAAFGEAAKRHCAELQVRVAGHSVLFRIAGVAWSEIVVAAMGHLAEVGQQTPELIVELWDVHGTGVAPPAAVQFEDDTPPILMRMSEDGTYIGEERHHGMTWLDRARNRIVGYTLDTGRLNLDERARPVHKLLSAWLEERGVQFVHSGLIAHAERGVLFVGSGGAGKSTSSICCLRAGMGYLGDDFIALGSDQGGFVGHGLYASCLLNVHHIKRFPDLLPLAHAPNHAEEEKYVLYLTEAFPSSLRACATVDALMLPRVVDADVTTYRRASKAETLLAIAPTSVMLLPRPNRDAFQRLARLVDTTPSFWLELGRSVDSIPDAVRSLAESLPVRST